jgi:hypothetical protein
VEWNTGTIVVSPTSNTDTDFDGNFDINAGDDVKGYNVGF